MPEDISLAIIASRMKAIELASTRSPLNSAGALSVSVLAGLGGFLDVFFEAAALAGVCRMSRGPKRLVLSAGGGVHGEPRGTDFAHSLSPAATLTA